MATKRKGSRTGGASAPAVARVTAQGRRELIVLARPEAGVRAIPGAPVLAATPAAAETLNAVLEASGATLTPLFGASEARARRGMPAAPGAPDLGAYYVVSADDDKLDDLVASLQALESVEAAYVRPAGEAPVLRDSVAAPLADEAPPATPNFSARQGYLDAAPGGIDARYAWTRPGGRGAGVCFR